ncbi:D-alanyl-D-alanine carboxypeptidase [Zobellella endophytica]|uniref:D-alanyl-D-alanine carboxypeptidase n=1 Tax=Zobellella endophytica TaxID=2116700 RepID=A0A2P7R951_9GAMM|nr:D-alanyl-D-alanine carboxypeptidase [Zobellella endophytica]PSJ46758.1 D-alanyl-D-alanine carboxypeptidase [Zobellella endophytica]
MFAVQQAGKSGFMLLALLFLFSLFNPAQANPRYAAIVIDADNGEVLHASNADATRYPASLTKMMTLYMLFEAMEQGLMTLDTAMPVSAHAASMPQTNLSLKAGDRLKVRDAIPALIVRSANDVAAVVAEALGGTESGFARMMTDKAKAMKMTATTFRNASGLPDSRQTSTARDLAILSLRLMKDFPQHYHYFSTQSFSYKGRTYNSHNRMVRNYAGVDGMKTGYIRASGFNVATSAKRGERRVIGVVMGGKTAQSRDTHMASLLDRSFTRASQIARVSAEAAAPASKLVISTDTVRQVARQAPETRAPAVVQRAQAPAALPRPSLTEELGWAVQIGSFRVPEQARDRASDAAKRLNDVDLAQIAVSEVEISDRKLFRARLVGLQENQAKNACQRLSRQGMDCLVVKLSGS